MAGPAPSESNTAHQHKTSKKETSKITFQHPMETKSAVNLSYTTPSNDIFQVQIAPATSTTQQLGATTTPEQRRSWFSSLFSSRRARKSDTSAAGR